MIDDNRAVALAASKGEVIDANHISGVIRRKLTAIWRAAGTSGLMFSSMDSVPSKERRVQLLIRWRKCDALHFTESAEEPVLHAHRVVIDQFQARNAHCCQLRRHLPADGTHADHGNMTTRQLLWRDDLPLADVPVCQINRMGHWPSMRQLLSFKPMF